MKHDLCLLAVLLVASTSNSIVIRHDVVDAECRVNVAEFPTLALLPGEGHGVLISKQWLVTAAHAAVWRPVHDVTLNGVSRRVAKVIVHPGYKAAPKELQSGDAAPLMKFMSASDDIALIKLEQPANDVRPATLYRGADEVGKMPRSLVEEQREMASQANMRIRHTAANCAEHTAVLSLQMKDGWRSDLMPRLKQPS